jgi:hypothetical protein
MRAQKALFEVSLGSRPSTPSGTLAVFGAFRMKRLSTNCSALISGVRRWPWIINMAPEVKETRETNKRRKGCS